MYECPYKECRFMANTQDEVDDHVIAAHSHGNEFDDDRKA